MGFSFSLIFILTILIGIGSSKPAAKPAAAREEDSSSPPPIPASFADCFEQFPQMALSNAAPSAEFFNVSPEDCLRFCSLDRICHTMVYHRHFSTCQLYSGAKEGEGAKEVGAKGHEIYTKRGECQQNGGAGGRVKAARTDEEGAKKDPKKEEEEKRSKNEGGR